MNDDFKAGDDGMIDVPAHVFDEVSLTVNKVRCLLGRVESGAPTGIEIAGELEAEAEACAIAIKETLLKTTGPGRGEFAKELGWPSADALVAFLFDGASVGDVH